MPVFDRSIAAACLAVLAACAPAPAPTGSATPAAPASPPAIAPVETETVIARYDCPGAGRIDLIRDGRHARLTMTDGRIVHIGAIQGSRPPIWSEVGLRFIVDGDFIEISEDSGRAFACTALPDGDPDGASAAD
ncbi:hypothetical protein LDO26_04785 [Luteimonas sp. BDR2-5]|uniref:hypothetical protein n=1 Tax=Proluteimonas luteida TaxID=2878685 RepID=UPI001E3B5E92|nr:hypothetical protein [Luteimonas sp. BDR2-5]MCD9027527.1 hypothetical protein [Luteimonas sp. BDR2-5]